MTIGEVTTIDSKLRAAQLIQLGMLKEIDRICRSHDIRYFLCGGTMLGAVRHEKFIPWDDDIDIMLLRKDYVRLLKVLEQELDPRYFLQTYETDKGYLYLFGKIRCNHTLFVEEVTRNHGIHQGIYLDVFPLDNIPDSKATRLFHRSLLTVLDVLRASSSLDVCRSSTDFLRRMIGFAMLPLAKLIVHRPFLRFVEKAAVMHQNQETRYVSNLYGNTIRWYDSPRQAHERSLYEEVEYKKFEDQYFPVPKGWHEYLSFLYGDYMQLPPPDERTAPHTILQIELDTRRADEAVAVDSAVR